MKRFDYRLKKAALAGLTAVEAIISTSMLVMIMLFILAMMWESEKAFEFSIIQRKLDENVSKTFDALKERLIHANILSVELGYQGAACIVYQIPVDTDSDGSVIDSQGNVEWGAKVWESTGPNQWGWVPHLDYVYRLYYAPNTNADYDFLSEYNDNRDYNGDEDTLDYFCWGEIREEVYEDQDDIIQESNNNKVYNPTPIQNGMKGQTPYNVIASGIMNAYTYGTDVDGDGSAGNDRLFDIAVGADGKIDSVTIKVVTMDMNTAKDVFRNVKNLTLNLRNPQESNVIIWNQGVTHSYWVVQ